MDHVLPPQVQTNEQCSKLCNTKHITRAATTNFDSLILDGQVFTILLRRKTLLLVKGKYRNVYIYKFALQILFVSVVYN